MKRLFGKSIRDKDEREVARGEEAKQGAFNCDDFRLHINLFQLESWLAFSVLHAGMQA